MGHITYGACATCGAYATNGTRTVQRKRDVVNISVSVSPRKKELKGLSCELEDNVQSVLQEQFMKM